MALTQEQREKYRKKYGLGVTQSATDLRTQELSQIAADSLVTQQPIQQPTGDNLYTSSYREMEGSLPTEPELVAKATRNVYGGAAKAVDWTAEKVDQLTRLPFLRLPFELAGQMGKYGGAAVGATVGAVGTPIENVLQGDPLFEGMQENIMETAKDTSQFAQKMMSEGSRVAPWVAMGKYPNALIGVAGMAEADDLTDFFLSMAEAAGSKFIKGGWVDDMFKNKSLKTTDDVLKKTDDLVSKERSRVSNDAVEIKVPKEGASASEWESYYKQLKATSPEVTTLEAAAGLRPDLKRQIQGSPEKMKEYVMISRARNESIDVPTPLEHGAQKVAKIENELRTIMNNTGSEIGKLREVTKNLKVSDARYSKVLDSFDNYIFDNFNLGVNGNGSIIRQPGKVSLLVSDSEIKLLNNIRNQIRVVKTSPTIDNILDLRDGMDAFIDYSKGTKEASSALDPLATKIRKELALMNEEVIGKDNVKLYREYSELKSLLNPRNKNSLAWFTKNATGAEFLLKRVLSERGRLPKDVISLIEKHTGENLLTDAVMIQLVTDAIGNNAQKGLLRQQIKNAGIDVLSLYSGIYATSFRMAKRLYDMMMKTDVGETLIKAAKNQEGFAKIPDLKGKGEIPETAFKNFDDLSTRTLAKLEGKTTISKQFISDLTNAPDLKQGERDLIRQVLKEFPDGKVNATEFANKVKSRLLPLEKQSMAGQMRYESIALPDDLRGNVANYDEFIYNSPIKNSAGDVHFQGNTSNYFAHTRIEDMAKSPTLDSGRMGELRTKNLEGKLSDAEVQEFFRLQDADNAAGSTRRVIEIQSDLFQKGRLESEGMFPTKQIFSKKELEKIHKEVADLNLPKDEARELLVKRIGDPTIEATKKEVGVSIAQLQPYRNTWHERVIREEIKRAATDGKTKLQFPTGETAMKIEGLGVENNFGIFETVNGRRDFVAKLTPERLKTGIEIEDNGGGEWIVTRLDGDGKFQAIQRDSFERIAEDSGKYPFPDDAIKALEDGTFNKSDLQLDVESFDISGKVDTSNPIYKFYEKDIRKYLNRIGDMKPITDGQGVTWFELTVPEEAKRLPIEAYAGVPLMVGATQTNEE